MSTGVLLVFNIEMTRSSERDDMFMEYVNLYCKVYSLAINK